MGKSHDPQQKVGVIGYTEPSFYLLGVDSEGRVTVKNQVVDPVSLEYVSEVGGEEFISGDFTGASGGGGDCSLKRKRSMSMDDSDDVLHPASDSASSM